VLVGLALLAFGVACDDKTPSAEHTKVTEPVSAASSGKAPATVAPPSAATPPTTVTSPSAATPASASASASAPGHEQGAQLYAKYCKLCHGADAKGYAADNAPSLVGESFLRGASDDFIADAIRLGRPDTAMAAYGAVRGGPLSDAQVGSIVAYLRSFGPQAQPLDESPVTGNPQRGSQIYAAQCQTCHGSDHERAKAPSLHNREFKSAATPGFLRQAIIEGRPPTEMKAFGDTLSKQQIEDVVAYLRNAPPAHSHAHEAHNAKVPNDLPLVINPAGKHPTFTLREGRFVSAAQVKRAFEEKRRMVLIDARSPADWLLFHIPGSVPMPYYDTERLSKIPNDGTWVIAYCACPHHASGEVVDALRRKGYKNTAVLDEGILFWKDHGYPLAGSDTAPKAKPHQH
jgi:cytochrome c oxidase cbb3-type subunit 3/ubiquinol-cytochrome c reductase cytochrome c subunit